LVFIFDKKEILQKFNEIGVIIDKKSTANCIDKSFQFRINITVNWAIYSL